MAEEPEVFEAPGYGRYSLREGPDGRRFLVPIGTWPIPLADETEVFVHEEEGLYILIKDRWSRYARRRYIRRWPFSEYYNPRFHKATRDFRTVRIEMPDASWREFDLTGEDVTVRLSNGETSTMTRDELLLYAKGPSAFFTHKLGPATTFNSVPPDFIIGCATFLHAPWWVSHKRIPDSWGAGHNLDMTVDTEARTILVRAVKTDLDLHGSAARS